MKISLFNIYKNTRNLILLAFLFMATIVWEGSTYTYTGAGSWDGANPPKDEQNEFTFKNNLIQSNNTGGYMLQAGIDPLPSPGYNNTLDGQIISGNKFVWDDPSENWWSITHGLFTGHERNSYIRYNYMDQVPMSIIRKSCNLMTDTSGGIYYNIINGGGVGVNIKGLSGVKVYNNTIYGNRTYSEQTWRPLVFIYSNTDTCASGTGGSPASDTKIKNNIFYTIYDQPMINLSDASCVPGFESDYNIFWSEENDGSIRFQYLGSTITFEAWKALGYDTHSLVMDPSFIDTSTFVPAQRLDYGTALTADYSLGLSTNVEWIVDVDPSTTLQNGTWQVGAVLYGEETPEADASIYYISPDGSDSGAGTISSPWFTLIRAWQDVSAGDIIYVRGGTYEFNSAQLLSTKNGTPDNYINVWAYPGETPIFTKSTTFTYPGWPSTLVRTRGNYQYWRGIEIAYATQTPSENLGGFTGYFVNNCIFELFNVHHCGGGAQLLSSGDNLFLNSDFHHNYDPYDLYGTDYYGDADGLGIQDDGYGTTNTIRGCRFWNNSDDGIDLWLSSKNVIIDNCWSWHNGYTEDGSTNGGDGNGFKLGPLYNPWSSNWDSSTTNLRTVTNCLAFDNRAHGFNQNGTLCAIHVYNNTSFSNKERGYEFPYGGSHIFRNNISASDAMSVNIGAASTIDHNSWQDGLVANEADFKNVIILGLDGSRQSNGNLPILTFLHLTEGSDLIGAGTDVGLTYDGDGNLWENPPSLGAYEYTEESSTSLPFVATTAITDISTYTATGGGNVTHDGSIALTYRGICWNTSSNPTVVNASTLDGSTGEGSYVSYLTGLSASTNYFVRAFAYNSNGLAYGDNVQFATLQQGEQPQPVPVSLSAPFLKSAGGFALRYGGFYLHYGTITDSSTPPVEPSTFVSISLSGNTAGIWAWDQWCGTWPCAYDVSFGIITENPVGHFTVISDMPDWITVYDVFSGQDLSVGSHVSDDPDRVLWVYPNSENNTTSDREGVILITNDFDGSAYFSVYQYEEPTAPTLTLAIDPCDYSNLDLSIYDSATVTAGSANAVVAGLYLVPWPYDYIGDMDVSWRAVRTDIEPNEDYGSGSLPTYSIDDSICETLVMSQSANSGQEFYVYFKQTPELDRTPTSKNFTKFGGDVSINIETNPSNPWSAADSCTWITLSNESSSGDGQFIITVLGQPSEGAARSGRVYINSQAPQMYVNITQDESIYYPITKVNTAGYDSEGWWLWNQYGVSADISIGITSSIICEVSAMSNWVFASLAEGGDITVGSQIQTGDIIRIHPINQNGTTPKDGSLLITNYSGGYVVYDLYQTGQPVEPDIQYVNNTGESFSITNEAGYINIDSSVLYYQFTHDISYGDVYYCSAAITDASSSTVGSFEIDLDPAISQTPSGSSNINRLAVSGDVFTITFTTRA